MHNFNTIKLSTFTWYNFAATDNEARKTMTKVPLSLINHVMENMATYRKNNNSQDN